MLVSLKWLTKYVGLPMSHEELAQRLSLSGLNHEGTDHINDDVVIDLEVTSNRGDCLGHIGVAREVGVFCLAREYWPGVDIRRNLTYTSS